MRPRHRPAIFPRAARVALGASIGLALVLALPAAGQEGGDPQRGREVFEQNCAMCHGQDASGMMGMHPSLRGAIERLSREGVEVTIRKGRDVRPPMPAFEGRLSDEEIAHVIAYLDALPVGPRNFGPGAGMMGDRDDMMGDADRRGSAWPPYALAGILGAALIATLAVLVLRLQAQLAGGGPKRPRLFHDARRKANGAGHRDRRGRRGQRVGDRRNPSP